MPRDLSADTPLNRRRLRLILRIVFGAVGVTYLLIALRGSWLRGEVTLPGAPVAVFGGAVVGAGLVAAGLSWAALFEPATARWRLVASFLVALVARYAPGGGVSQAVGQISLATSDTVSQRQASARFVVHAGVQVVVAGAIAGLLAFDEDQMTAVRVAAALVLISPLLLTPRWMLPVLERIASLMNRPAPSDGLLPTRRRMLISAGLLGLSTLGGGLVFAVVLRELDPGTSISRATLVYAAAWAAGYLAVPFPAGIGVREAVLVALLPASAATVVPASVIHRLLTMIVEVIVFPVAWWRSR